MLHLIWYLFVGFLVGCVAKALMHMHLSITWTVVLGIVGSIIGGAVTHLFYPRGNCNLNLCQMYKTRIAPMMDTINPPR